MALQHDPWRKALAASQSTAAASDLNDCENSETILKPTRGHKAAITELCLRFPCPRDTDPDAYRARVEYLEKDTAHLAVPLLRAACDRAAQSARGLPYASEIINCAAVVVEERQRAKDRTTPTQQGFVSSDEKRAELSRQYNRENMSSGNPVRWTEKMEAFRPDAPGETRWTREDGSIAGDWRAAA